MESLDVRTQLQNSESPQPPVAAPHIFLCDGQEIADSLMTQRREQRYGMCDESDM